MVALLVKRKLVLRLSRIIDGTVVIMPILLDDRYVRRGERGSKINGIRLTRSVAEEWSQERKWTVAGEGRCQAVLQEKTILGPADLGIFGRSSGKALTGQRAKGLFWEGSSRPGPSPSLASGSLLRYLP